MKKLITMLAAAAMGVMSYADPFVNKFDASTAADLTGWTGVAGENAVLEGGLLKLKTGSTVVGRTIQAGGFQVDENVYFDVSLDVLGQALDELPAVDANAKLALFVLDGTEIDGAPDTTKLYAVAGNGEGGKWLVELGANMETLLAGTSRITLKGYKNVLKAGVNSGFTVFQDGGATAGTIEPLRVAAVYAMAEDGTVTWTDIYNSNTYLKDQVITPLTQKRTSVILSLQSGVDGQTFESVDFQGNANVSVVEINDSGFAFIGDDLQSAALTLNGVSVTVDPAENYVDGLLIGNATITATATDSKKPVIKGTNVDATETANVFSYEFANGKDVTLTAYELAATIEIDGATTQYASVAEALDAVAAADEAVVKLFKSESISCMATSGSDITIDLNGQTLTGTGDVETGATAVIYVGEGETTIVDSSEAKTGKVVASGDGIAAVMVAEGKLNIEAGTFDGAIVDSNDPVKTTIYGGKFASEDDKAFYLKDALVDGKTATYAGGYWTVVQAVTASVTIEHATATVSVEDGDEVAVGTEVTVSNVVAAEGYKNAKVMINDVERDSYTVTAEDTELVISVTATAKDYVVQIGESKYESLKDAAANAKAGDTITILKDYTESEVVALNVAGAIAIVNDYTVSFSTTGNYPVQINTATVTISGNGTWLRPESNSSSLIQIGAAAPATVTINGGTFTSTGTTTKNAPSNIIQVKNGTLNFNGGVVYNTRLENGRGIRSCGTTNELGEANSDAKVYINGGKITACGTDDKSQPLDIELVPNSKAALTIPGTSTAAFNKDMSKFCAAGYETVLDTQDNMYKVAAIPTYTVAATTGANYTTTIKVGEEEPVTYTDPVTVLRGTAVVVTYTANEGYKITDGGTVTYEAVAANVVAPAPTVEKTGPAVDPGEGTIVQDGGNFVVTPAADATSITVSNLPVGFGGKVIVPADKVAAITGVPAANLEIKVNGYVVANDYFVGMSGDTFSTALSNAAAPVLTETAPLEVATDVSVSVKAIPGLKYQLIRGSEPSAIAEPVATAQVASATTITLKDEAKPADKAFYKVKVTK